MMLAPSEKKWVWIFAAVVAIVTAIPYCIAYSRFGSQEIFSGFLFGIEDGNSYIAKMVAGANGDWLFRSPYTAYTQNGLLAFFPYILLGKLAVLPGLHEQLVALFHLFRIGAVFLDIYATYFLIARFIKQERLRKLATFFATFGGGLGWLLILIGQSGWLGSLPLDFYSPESFGFLEIFGLPHLAAARGLLFISLGKYLDLVGTWQDLPDQQKLNGSGFTGLLLLLTGLFQPLTALVGWVVIGAHLVVLIIRDIRDRNGSAIRTIHEYQSLGAVFVLSSPIILYTGITSLTDPYMQSWTAQNIIRSPNPLHYLVAYGLVIPFAIAGGIALIHKDFRRGSFLVTWMVLFPFLAYFPYNLQRRLPEGIWVILVVAALAWVERNRSRSKISSLYMLGLGLPSVLIFLFGSVASLQQPVVPVYRPKEEVRAFNYLASQATSVPVVLAAYDTGNALPAWAPVRVLVGHGPESIHFSSLKPAVDAFFQSRTPDVDRRNLIRQFSVQYIFWGPLERKLGNWDPHTAPYLVLEYEHAGYSIFALAGKENGL